MRNDPWYCTFMFAGSETYHSCWYSSYACWSTSEMLAERSSSKTNFFRDSWYTKFYKGGLYIWWDVYKISQFDLCFPFIWFFFSFCAISRLFEVLDIRRDTQVDLIPGRDEAVDAAIFLFLKKKTCFGLVSEMRQVLFSVPHPPFCYGHFHGEQFLLGCISAVTLEYNLVSFLFFFFMSWAGVNDCWL